jgi:hypothetical protein
MNAARIHGLSGISEWKWDGVWTQAAVDRRWKEIGGPAPTPILPSDMEGAKIIGTRGPRVLKYASGKLHAPNAVENDFWNYFMKVASDPYRKQSGISKVAGGVLQVASAAIPAFGYFQAVAAAGNMVAARQAVKTDANLTARVMAPALAADDAKDTAQFNAKIENLKALSAQIPKQGPSPALAAQNNFAAAVAPVTATQRASATQRVKVTQKEFILAIAGLLGFAVLKRLAR